MPSRSRSSGMRASASPRRSRPRPRARRWRGLPCAPQHGPTRNDSKHGAGPRCAPAPENAPEENRASRDDRLSPGPARFRRPSRPRNQFSDPRRRDRHSAIRSARPEDRALVLRRLGVVRRHHVEVARPRSRPSRSMLRQLSTTLPPANRSIVMPVIETRPVGAVPSAGLIVAATGLRPDRPRQPGRAR